MAYISSKEYILAKYDKYVADAMLQACKDDHDERFICFIICCKNCKKRYDNIIWHTNSFNNDFDN